MNENRENFQNRFQFPDAAGGKKLGSKVVIWELIESMMTLLKEG